MTTTCLPVAALETVAGLVLEEDTRWGAVATDHQWNDARAVLTVDESMPRLHFVTRPRGGSKTSDIAAIAIGALLHQMRPGEKAIAVAVDGDQAAYITDAVAMFTMLTPELKGLLRVEGRKVTVTAGPTRGAFLQVLTSDGPSSWGLRNVVLFLLDEIAQWPSTTNARTVFTSVVSAVPKRRGARLVLLTSAGDPAHWSYKIRQHAARSPKWRLSEMPGPVAWADPADLAEQRELLTESQFARLHLNVWTAAEDRLVDPEDLAAAVQLSGPLRHSSQWPYVIGVDLGLKDDRTVIAVCHAEQQQGRMIANAEVLPRLPRVVLDRMIVFAGTRKEPVELDEVERAIEQAAWEYRAPVVIDPWQSVGMAQRLRSRRVLVDEFAFTPQSVGRLAATMHQLLSSRMLALPDDAELLEELGNVRMRETSPGVLRMDHDRGRHDDRAVALALSAHRLIQGGRDMHTEPRIVVGQRWGGRSGLRR